MKKFLKAKDTKAAIAACPALTGPHSPFPNPNPPQLHHHECLLLIRLTLVVVSLGAVDGAAAIYLFTCESPLYRQLNGKLRARNRAELKVITDQPTHTPLEAIRL
eukprot:COSAG04_NODE_8410_length_980_cov_0.979569_2_plen_105_part_00